MIDIKVPAQRARNAEPTVAMNQRTVDFIELINTNKAAQFAAIIHNAACPVGTYARHTLQQSSVGCIEIEHSVGAELVTLPHCMLLPCAPRFGTMTGIAIISIPHLFTVPAILTAVRTM